MRQLFAYLLPKVILHSPLVKPAQLVWPAHASLQQPWLRLLQHVWLYRLVTKNDVQGKLACRSVHAGVHQTWSKVPDCDRWRLIHPLDNLAL